MAQDAVAFIRALGLEQVDLLGFSMGGMIAQLIAAAHPQLVRKAILAGTGPAGGVGITNVTRLSHLDTLRGLLTLQDPKQFSSPGQPAGVAPASSCPIKERTQNGQAHLAASYGSQLTAKHGGASKRRRLFAITAVPRANGRPTDGPPQQSRVWLNAPTRPVHLPDAARRHLQFPQFFERALASSEETRERRRCNRPRHRAVAGHETRTVDVGGGFAYRGLDDGPSATSPAPRPTVYPY